MRLLPQLGAALLAGVVLAMLLAPIARRVHAADVYAEKAPNGQPIALRLSQAPCTHAGVREKLKLFLPEAIIAKARFRAATLTWGGRDWASCWIEIRTLDEDGQPSRSVWSVDEQGDPFNPPYGIPRSLFKDDAI